MSKEIVLLNLSNYVRPQVVENHSRDWVLNGRNNSFYQYVIDRFNGSPTNAAIINSYNDLIYGKGLIAKGATLGDATQLKSVLQKQDLRRIIADFELFGEFSAQIVQTNGKKLSAIKHIAKNLVVPSIVNDENEIESYWFSRNWSRLSQNPAENIPAFSGKHKLEIYRGMPYKAGKLYFADPDYLAGMPYADMEEEIANLNINSIKNGLSAGYIINVPNGNSWEQEDREKFEKDIKKKLTGSPNASSFVLSFNGVEEEITITPFPVNENIHKQWEFLTSEARQQLLTAHRVVSPMLFGIKDNTGLGNNADELDTAEAQLVKRVIRPKQDFITDALEEILRQYGINLDLEFIPLTAPVIEPQTTELAKHCDKDCKDCDCKKKVNVDLDELINLGEIEDLDNYNIVDEVEVDYDEVINLARVVTDHANAKSEQDNKDVIIRYRYAGSLTGERDFCNRMVNANKVYRKEDIEAAENKAVNPGWGINGADTYSIWLYKGGGNCYHKWNRVIYLRKGIKIDVNSPLAETISTSKARQKGFKVPVNSGEDNLASIAPIRMPNQGFVTK